MVVAHPEGCFAIGLGDAHRDKLVAPLGNFPSESLFENRDQQRVRLDPDDPMPLALIISAVVAVADAEIEDEVRRWGHRERLLRIGDAGDLIALLAGR